MDSAVYVLKVDKFRPKLLAQYPDVAKMSFKEQRKHIDNNEQLWCCNISALLWTSWMHVPLAPALESRKRILGDAGALTTSFAPQSALKNGGGKGTRTFWKVSDRGISIKERL